MFLIYTPDGQEVQRFPVKLGKLRSMEIEAIEKRTGWDYGTDFAQHLQKGSALARRALLWTMLRRQHPTLKFDEVDFAHDELELAYDKAELEEILAGIDAAPYDTEAQRAAAKEQIVEAMKTAPEPEGKAPGKSAAAATSGK